MKRTLSNDPLTNETLLFFCQFSQLSDECLFLMFRTEIVSLLLIFIYMYFQAYVRIHVHLPVCVRVMYMFMCELCYAYFKGNFYIYSSCCIR
jgi:hypothetical protein